MLAIDSIQIALFAEPAADRSALALWTKVFRGQPLGFNTLGNGVSQCNGLESSYAVILQAQAARVDLIFSAQAVDPGADAQIEDYAAAMKFALDKAAKALAAINVAQRVAIVTTASKEQPDVAAAVADVRASVPGLVSPEGATDLWYQTSVQRASVSVPGVKLTLTPRWHTGLKQMMQIVVSPNSQPMPMPGKTKIISIYYVDVFVAEPSKLFPKKAVSILDELANHTAELLSKGYEYVAQN